MTIVLGGQHIGTETETVMTVTQATAKGGLVQVVLLTHLRFGTMVIGGEDGGYGGVVLIERGIHRTIGDECRSLQTFGHIDRCGNALQVIIGSRGVGTNALGGAPQILQHRPTDSSF